ncbi:hypothetical protein CLPU_3c00970 [Gottschalkia purinilytica]|uniref:Uncharacterized protein n=1 Tax=Gottschalkia purinilytica TaxID=1503 RepID=A0A0L0WCV9_GOTPU|nr:hypothetical protein [Gottschalkia purinilytica]KNF09319.1 hypothetical protein CLPU_3c00970 [Gottschalkia purinilytica]
MKLVYVNNHIDTKIEEFLNNFAETTIENIVNEAYKTFDDDKGNDIVSELYGGNVKELKEQFKEILGDYLEFPFRIFKGEI